jgi:arylsulfatase A-like enzyme
MSSELNRRDFLKLMALLPLAGVRWRRPSAHRCEQAALAESTPVTDLHDEQSRTIQASAFDKPNFLILVFDALSAKNMSLYGYERETTPNLARFAEQATVYHRHYAGGNHTSPGVGSLLTGTYPWSHRALHLHGTVDRSYQERNLFSTLEETGYYTFGYSHNLLVMSLMHQFRQDLDLLKKTRELCLIDDEVSDQLFFDDYNAAFWSEWMLLREGKSPPGALLLSLIDRARRFIHRKQLERRHGDRFPRGIPHLHSLFFVLEDAIDWLENELAQASAPFGGYVHVLPPHEPYFTRREFVGRFEDGWSPEPKDTGAFSQGHSNTFLNRQRREYDEYLAYADAEFGRLYDWMTKKNVLENTYVVITSDHGELFERGIRGHVTPALYDPVIHVPLLIAKPGQKQREDVHTPTSAVDLLPTLLHAAGRPVPDWCEGRILPTFDGEKKDTERSVFAVEAKGNPKQAPLTEASVALIRGQYKLTHYFGYSNARDGYELYDLTADPEEMENIYSASESVAADLRDELEQKLKAVNERFS